MFSLNYSKLKVGSNSLFLSKVPCRNINKKCINQYIIFLKENNIKTVIILLEEDDYVEKMINIYKENDITAIHFPIRDYSVPKKYEGFHRLIKQINSKLKSGSALIHCAGGHGRTGMVAAGLAVYKGHEPNAAMKLIRKVRKGSIETQEQEWFIENYHEYKSLREEIISSDSQL